MQLLGTAVLETPRWFLEKHHYISVIHDQSSLNKEQQGAVSFNRCLNPNLSATIKMCLKVVTKVEPFLGAVYEPILKTV